MLVDFCCPGHCILDFLFTMVFSESVGTFTSKQELDIKKLTISGRYDKAISVEHYGC